MKTILQVALCLSGSLLQGAIIQEDSHHKRELQEFLEQMNFEKVATTAVAYDGNLRLYFNRNMSIFAGSRPCGKQRSMMDELYEIWSKAIDPKPVTGIMIYSHKGREFMKVERSPSGFSYHC